MQKVLVTGGAGFIGSNLVSFLLQNNYEIVVIDNLITGQTKNIEPFLQNKNFKFIEKNLNEINLEEELGKNNFDIVFHLASPASPIQYKKNPIETSLVNSYGTYKLLEYIKNSPNTKFLFASTSEVYGDPFIHPQVEEYFGNVNPNGVRSCYDESKRMGESFCMTYFRNFNLDIRIFRIFNTFGPNMEKEDGRVISNFIVQALQNKPITIYGDGNQTRSFCFVDDLIKGIYLMSQKDIKGKIINLGNPQEMKILEIAEIIKKLTNSNSKIIFEKITEDDPKKRQPDISKAKALLNWEPVVKLEDGLLKAVEYFKLRFNL